ncbi:pyridoxal phosphate-dependent aminotransferase [Gallaecimonas sp. GXIMD4217]|uniref:pyridoxal phosphate-dependent aminotransferase n=1 Tax=Gallaecimonas sp. GXIMD4217 TaxID=3131927 RepID=UPI00311B1B51
MTDLFADHQVPLDLLAKRAFNFRWAETEPGVIPLTAADPDFPVAREIRDAISDYAQSGLFSYGPHLGLKDFRLALAEAMGQRRGYDLNPDWILPIDSAASGMYAIARAYLRPGDEMIIFDPVDFLFEQSALAAGATVKRCPFDEASGRFRLDRLDGMVSDRTRLIGVCNPHNPLGRLMRQDELAEIAAFAERHDLWIMNDEIWSDIVFPEQDFVSFHHQPLSSDRVITVYGFSKAFGLAGLRIGAVMAPSQESFDAITAAAHVMTTAGGVATLSQVAATTALRDCWYWVDAFTDHLRAQRDLAVARLNAMPGVSCTVPEATYLLFPDIRATGMAAEALVDHLHREARLAVVPGNARFFGPGAEGHIRICFATSRAILSEGLDRMEKALIALRQGR